MVARIPFEDVDPLRKREARHQQFDFGEACGRRAIVGRDKRAQAGRPCVSPASRSNVRLNPQNLADDISGFLARAPAGRRRCALRDSGERGVDLRAAFLIIPPFRN